MKGIRKIFFFLLLFFLLVSLIKNIFDHRQKVKFYESIEKEFQEEKQNNISLKTQALKNSDAYRIEQTLRDKMNLSRPDEVVVLIPSPTQTPVQIDPTPLPPYIQWWHTFFEN